MAKKDDAKTWVIRDVDEETRRLVKVYGTRHNKTAAQALHDLVLIGARVLEYLALDDIPPRVLARELTELHYRLEDAAREHERLRPKPLSLREDPWTQALRKEQEDAAAAYRKQLLEQRTAAPDEPEE